MAEYVKKSDVIKIMENNSHMIEVFGVKKKMIDGFAMCCDFADLKIVEIDDEEEINMKPEEAKDILSDMRDQHLCFIESSENKDEWQKKYLKEAWACDSGAKALEKQIPCKPEEYVPDFPYNIFSTQKCAKCGTPVIGKKISKYCSECGQKIDWGDE
jgi:hypothetical protein|nr:MAG TPA: zinc-ribbon containing domain protein [Caudoviricetes sp.]